MPKESVYCTEKGQHPTLSFFYCKRKYYDYKGSYNNIFTNGVYVSLTLGFKDKSENPNLEQTGKMLSVMARTGAPSEMITTMLDFALGGKLSKEHRQFLNAPIIQQQSQWMETTPPWMYKAITYDRLQVVLEEIPQGKVGWKVGMTELATVIYPITMDAPLRYELSQIYLWAAAHANAYHYNMTVDAIWQQLGITPVKDEDIISPKGQFHYGYKNLCSDIRRKVVKAGMEKEKTVKYNNTNTISPKKKKQPPSNIQGTQLNLF